MNSHGDDDIPDLPEEEMEMELEQLHGRPVAGIPAERIVPQTKRISYLEDLLKSALDAADARDDHAAINGIKNDLTKARTLLKEWQTQHDSRN